MIACPTCKGERVTPGVAGFGVCPECRGVGSVPEPDKVVEPAPDTNVSFLPSGEFTPLAVATKVLARVKEADVMSLVSYMTIGTSQGVGILPFCSNVGLAELSMISATAQAMTMQLLQAGVVLAPKPDKSA